MTEEEIRFLDAQDYWGLMNLNMQYAISHRERVMRREPISFPEYELRVFANVKKEISCGKSFTLYKSF